MLFFLPGYELYKASDHIHYTFLIFLPAYGVVHTNTSGGFPGGSVGKEPCAGGTGLISGLGRPSGGGYSNPLQYSCLENPMDWGAGGLQFIRSQSVSDVTEATSIHAQKYTQQTFKQTCRLETVTGQKSHWVVLQQLRRQPWVQQPSYQTLRKSKMACRPWRRLRTGRLPSQVWLQESKQTFSRLLLGK